MTRRRSGSKLGRCVDASRSRVHSRSCCSRPADQHVHSPAATAVDPSALTASSPSTARPSRSSLMALTPRWAEGPASKRVSICPSPRRRLSGSAPGTPGGRWPAPGSRACPVCSPRSSIDPSPGPAIACACSGPRGWAPRPSRSGHVPVTRRRSSSAAWDSTFRFASGRRSSSRSASAVEDFGTGPHLANTPSLALWWVGDTGFERSISARRQALFEVNPVRALRMD